jgi:hypothetical protein
VIERVRPEKSKGNVLWCAWKYINLWLSRLLALVLFQPSPRWTDCYTRRIFPRHRSGDAAETHHRKMDEWRKQQEMSSLWYHCKSEIICTTWSDDDGKPGCSTHSCFSVSLTSSDRLLSLSYRTSLKWPQWIILHHADLGKRHGGFEVSVDSWHASVGPFPKKESRYLPL